MPRTDRLQDHAYAIALAQRLAAPAQAILGYQELIVEEVRETGPAEALQDLEKVLLAARTLTTLVSGLVSGDVPAPDSADAEAVLRHDLRTPMNAILGYSEMVAEEFGDAMPARLLDDIMTVRREGRHLLEQIDTIISHARDEPAFGDGDADATDQNIAAQLASSLAESEEAGAPETGTILVVDDTRMNRDLLARRLRRDGHSVKTAASATAALEIMNSCAIDVALVDILMPGVNGIELLGKMKGDPSLRGIPVLMISGLTEQDAVMRCITAGAEDYLPKPVDPVLLRARISACLERRRWAERERQYLSRIQAERDRARTLLHAILPEVIVRRLEDGEAVIADRFDAATIVFADIVDFTPLAARTSPSSLLQRLGALFSHFDELADHHGVEKIKTIGDAYMVAAGIPVPRADHADIAIAFARSMVGAMHRDEGPSSPLKLRVGVNSGPVVAGLIGRKRFVYDIWGHTVNLASRLESVGTPDRIQISESTLDALGADTPVDPQGEIEIKGIGRVRTFLLAG